MARTAAGAALTEQHYQAQVGLRSVALQDFLKLLPIWRGDEASFKGFVTATVPLVGANRQISASMAASYYEAFRLAEGVAGSPTPRLAEQLVADKVKADLYVTGAEQTRKAILSGQSPEAAMRTAHVRMAGSVGRNVLRGGAETIVLSSGADREAGGWYRVTSATPCAFCAMLASRGAVYSEDTVDFQSHDHCTCQGEPAYNGSTMPGRGKEFKKLYDEATLDAHREGDLSRGTSNDLLNAFRRRYQPAP